MIKEPEAPVERSEPVHVLERGVRLSRSFLWQVQRAFFEQGGPGVWSSSTVPHYVTSNPFLAGGYARIVLGFLRDCRAAGAAFFDGGRPLHILELGSGSGRFTYHFLRKLLPLLRASTLADVPVKVVMTDFAESNLASFRAHPRLAPYFAEGTLDVARFDVERDWELRLERSGEVLSPDAPGNPVVVIANYVFDSIPQDAFLVRGGKLHESLLTVSSLVREPDLGDPEMLARLLLAYEHRPVEGDYYGDAELDAILEGYRERLADTALLFPVTALGAIRSLAALGGGKMLLLSADKGDHSERHLLGGREPGIAAHGGAFSMSVNYHAIGRYVAARSGRALHPPHLHCSISVGAFALGSGACPETALAYEEVTAFGPDDYFLLTHGVERMSSDLALPQILAYLRLSGWDAHVVLGCHASLLAQVASAEDAVQEDVYRALRLVWDLHYPIGEERDLALHLAVLLHAMRYFPEALDFLPAVRRASRPLPRRVLHHGVVLSWAPAARRRCRLHGRRAPSRPHPRRGQDHADPD